LLEKDVREIRISPCITPYPGWERGSINKLDAEFARVAEISRNHLEQTGAVPVTILRKATDEIPKRSGTMPACNALTGDALTMDLDGQLYTCSLFAESYQKFQPGSLMEQLSKVKLGDVRDPEVRNRRAALAKSTRIENARASLKSCSSIYGNCDECEYYGRCLVCPVSVWQASSTTDCRRIPDFICAFNRVALKYRDRFPSVPEGLKKLLPEPDASDPIRRLEEYLSAKKNGEPGDLVQRGSGPTSPISGRNEHT
jgi:hypothetical protein